MLNFTGATAGWSGNEIGLIFHRAAGAMQGMNSDPLELAKSRDERRRAVVTLQFCQLDLHLAGAGRVR